MYFWVQTASRGLSDWNALAVEEEGRFILYYIAKDSSKKVTMEVENSGRHVMYDH